MTSWCLRVSLCAMLATAAGISAQAQQGFAGSFDPYAHEEPYGHYSQRNGTHPNQHMFAECEQCPVDLQQCNSNGDNRVEFTAALLYLQPTAGNLEYGTRVNPLPAPSPHWNNQAVEVGLSPAFEVGMRYIVPCTGNDIGASWTHLDASDSNSFEGNPGEFAGPLYIIGPDANLWEEGHGSVDFQFDSVNLEVGHSFVDGSNVALRVFGGLQYARLDQELTGSFASYDQSYSASNTSSSQFNGVGPRLGLEANIVHGRIDFLGQIAGSALVGRQESRLDFATDAPNLPGLGITPPNEQYLAGPDSTQVVPSIESKLGGGYRIPMRNGSSLRFEAGYQAAVYINAISQYTVSDVVVPPNVQGIGVFLESAYLQQYSFAAHGPYVSMNWEF